MEPWLREIDLGIHPALAQPVFALMQVREDLERHTAGLTDEQVWASPAGITSVGFHLAHIAGSTERLATYLVGRELSEEQLAAMGRESDPGSTRDELLARVGRALDGATAAIRALPEQNLGALRFVGRKRIRTTAIGLAIHIGEHALRHTGQVVTACQVLRGW